MSFNNIVKTIRGRFRFYFPRLIPSITSHEVIHRVEGFVQSSSLIVISSYDWSASFFFFFTNSVQFLFLSATAFSPTYSLHFLSSSHLWKVRSFWAFSVCSESTFQPDIMWPIKHDSLKLYQRMRKLWINHLRTIWFEVFRLRWLINISQRLHPQI